MSDARVSAELAAIRERRGRLQKPGIGLELMLHGLVSAEDVPRLLAAVEAVLFAHRIEPLFAHADDGECGCPVPADVAEDAAYDVAHPEGYGPDGSGVVCLKKTVGHWCRGCADVAVEHGCFETPKSYAPENCELRAAIERALTGEDASDDA